jgi:8-oxo-dGTP diphosphatase
MQTIYGTIIAVKLGKRVLLLKRVKDDIDGGLWEFPTETYENLDMTIHATAERGLREETGLEVKDIKYLGDLRRTDDDKLLIGYAYVANASNNGVRLSEEHSEYRWVKKSELANYELDENTLKFLELHKDF